MSNKPSHKAYLVTEAKEGSGQRAHWLEVGAVWPHRNGNGFDLVIPEGLAVTGRIVCVEPRERTGDKPA
jgi:hypothetical protein